MQKEEIKFQDSTVFEGMTSIRAILEGRAAGIHDRRIRCIYFDPDKKDKNKKALGYLKAVSEKEGFILCEKSADKLAAITLGTSHGGIVAVTETRTIPQLSAETPLRPDGFYVMIQGIEDPYNFGYALRSLYACGVDGVILPLRNWMSAAGVVCRSSAGASERIPLYTAEAVEAARLMKRRGYTVVCADERTDRVLGTCPLPCPLLLIVGGEKRGISGALLEECDIPVRIPYARPFHASLSAASAATMFAYEIMRQRLSPSLQSSTADMPTADNRKELIHG